MVGCDLSALPDDFGSTREIKQIALTEIYKQQSGAGIQLQIAKSIKVTIAREVGNGQSLMIIKAHKARLTTAMGNIYAPGCTRRIVLIGCCRSESFSASDAAAAPNLMPRFT